MKVTKSQVKEIIRENIESLPIDNLIAGISGLVQDMDPELVGVVFTTVFKDIEGAPAGAEGEEEIEAAHRSQIGFEENLQRIILEEINSDDALMGAINRLAGKIESLDVSIDYLAASVTGEDPVALGFGQAAMGRASRVKKRAPVESPLNEYVTQDREAQAVLNQLSVQQQRVLVQVKDLVGIEDSEFVELLKDPRRLGDLINLIAQEREMRIAEGELGEVSSEKQRRWACAQKDKSASQRADSLSAAEAEEMCTSEVEE